LGLKFQRIPAALKCELLLHIRSAVGELIADIFGSSDEEEEFEASFEWQQ